MDKAACSPDELRIHLTAAGFKDITIKQEGAKHWLAVTAVFWQIQSQADINERQRTVLNIFLDGDKGKLTAKRWAKLSKVSPDTAVRDVQYLAEIGILIPEEGKVRNIAYGIKISDKRTLIPGPAEEE